jgi:hypothetical protein
MIDFIRQRNPQTPTVKAQDFMDDRFIKELDESGFIKSLYAKISLRLCVADKLRVKAYQTLVVLDRNPLVDAMVAPGVIRPENDGKKSVDIPGQWSVVARVGGGDQQRRRDDRFRYDLPDGFLQQAEARSVSVRKR